MLKSQISKMIAHVETNGAAIGLRAADLVDALKLAHEHADNDPSAEPDPEPEKKPTKKKGLLSKG